MNTAIKTFLTNHLLENKSAFFAINDLHPLLEPFRTEVSALSIEESTAAFFAELEANIQNWWTNPEKDIDACLFVGLLYLISSITNPTFFLSALSVLKTISGEIFILIHPLILLIFKI